MSGHEGQVIGLGLITPNPCAAEGPSAKSHFFILGSLFLHFLIRVGILERGVSSTIERYLGSKLAKKSVEGGEVRESGTGCLPEMH